MATTELTVQTAADLRRTVTSYASRGFQTVRDEGNIVTLSKRRTFNWILAIICLFIPIIGWIALIMMIAAAARGSEVVTIIHDPAGEHQFPNARSS
jgi:hypothetical protein